MNDTRPLRLPENRAELERKFQLSFNRRVSADHVVSIDSIEYEVPRGYAGTQVTLYRKVLIGSIHLVHQGKLIELQPVDRVANAHAQRARDRGDDQVHPMPPITAAELSFNRDFQPIIDADGGFSATSNEDSTESHL